MVPLHDLVGQPWGPFIKLCAHKPVVLPTLQASGRDRPMGTLTGTTDRWPWAASLREEAKAAIEALAKAALPWPTVTSG